MAIWLAASPAARAQVERCELVADTKNPTEYMLRCGDGLTVRTAPGSSYHSVDPQGREPPKALQVDRGAVEVEFHATRQRHDFQILTPVAIAAVRGTKWIVDVTPGATSTFVIAGTVVVRRRGTAGQVRLEAGQGVDVGPGPGPLTVKRWPPARVRTLLARFGEG